MKSAFGFLLFVGVLVLVIVFCLRNDHFWTRQPVFVHYSDVGEYWMGQYARRMDSSSAGGAMVPVDSERMLDMADEAMDVLEEELGVTESDVAATATETATTVLEIGDSARATRQRVDVFVKLDGLRLGPFALEFMQELSAPTQRSRHAVLLYAIATSKVPLLFLASPTTVPNVVPLLTFRRHVWVSPTASGGEESRTGATEDTISKEEAVLSSGQRRRSLGRRSGGVHRVQLFASLLPVPAAADAVLGETVASQATRFAVRYKATSSLSGWSEYASFLFRYVSTQASPELVIVCNDAQRNEELASGRLFLFSVRDVELQGQPIVASAGIRFRKEDRAMHLVSLVFADDLIVTLSDASSSMIILEAVKCAAVVMMLQELDKIHDDDMKGAMMRNWVIDGVSDGLLFMQQRAPTILSLAFRTSASTLPSLFEFGADMEMALYVANGRFPLQMKTMYTDM